MNAGNSRRTSVIVGLGRTGLSCARYLAAAGDRIVVTDTRENPPGLAQLRKAMPDCELHLGGFNASVLARVDRLVVSPGVALDEPFIAAARQRNVAVTGDIDLFSEAVRAPVVAITGSNGKSTVTTMLAAMLEAGGLRVLAGGNLGTPALDLLGEPVPDFYLLELSSFQLERTASLPTAAAVVLNVSPDHMDRYGSVHAYARVKARVYKDTKVPVYNRDDPRVCAMVGAFAGAIGFGGGEPEAGQFGLRTVDGHERLCYGRETLLPADAMLLRGRHNAINGLAALALVEGLHAPREPALAALRSYAGLPHRMQWVSDAHDLVWINDSKGTNVGATVAAVGGIRGALVLIGGGDAKRADFTPLVEVMRDHARAAVLLGRDAERMAAALGEVCPVRLVTDMATAVRTAAELAEPGDTVLLSPACSSLDMYADYQARGDAFVTAVREYAA